MTTVKNYTKHFLSTTFLKSAERLTDSVCKYEQQCNNEKVPIYYSDYQENVINVIILATTYLESIINEFFSNVTDSYQNGFKLKEVPLDSDTLRKLSDLWNIEKIQHLSILEKYDLALITAGKEKFDKGRNTSQNSSSCFRHWVTQN